MQGRFSFRPGKNAFVKSSYRGTDWEKPAEIPGDIDKESAGTFASGAAGGKANGHELNLVSRSPSVLFGAGTHRSRERTVAAVVSSTEKI